MKDYLIGILKIFGVVFLRFRPMPRLWNIWLVGVNLACLYFIQHIEAQVVLGVTTLSVLAQGVIYQKIGFTRVLGVAHMLWLPMFAWMTLRYAQGLVDPAIASWLVVLAVTNGISSIIDTADVVRFLRGERAPHYRWS